MPAPPFCGLLVDRLLEVLLDDFLDAFNRFDANIFLPRDNAANCFLDNLEDFLGDFLGDFLADFLGEFLGDFLGEFLFVLPPAF